MSGAPASDRVIRCVLIRGRVQGVGFRAWTEYTANDLGLAGWVRNLDSGRVEAVFEGPRSRVEEMLRWAREGPPGSYVRDVRVDWDEPPEQLQSFEIRHTGLD